MCPSLAEPDSGGFPRTSRRQRKVFWSNNFSKMLPRCGRAAHICEANLILQSVFPAAIAFFETYKFSIAWILWNKLQIRTRQRGNCSMLVGKSRGGTPFCRMLKIVLPKNVFRWGVSLQLFHRNSYKMSVSDSDFTRRGGLVRPASKSCRFSHRPLRVPEAWHGNFAACGQRSGLLALNLASIFEKLLDQKTFCLPAARDWKHLS